MYEIKQVIPNDRAKVLHRTDLWSTLQIHSVSLLLKWTAVTVTEDNSHIFLVFSQRGVSEDRDKVELSWAVKEELSDWQLSSLRPTEVEVEALDPSFSGTLNRSQITHLFLKNDIPLKLPTFFQLLQMFSDKDDSDQVR